MKMIFRLAVFTVVGAFTLQAGPQEIAKQRAKELNNQNNVRQGVGAPAPAPQRTAPATAAQPLPANPVAQLKADVAAIMAKAPAAPELKQRFARDMLAAARGSHKPELATLQKFSESLAGILAGKSLDAAEQSRLVQNLNLALNSASLSAQRSDEVASDTQAILQVGGASRGTALAVTADFKAIMAELQAAK
jgi:hypothetical protein